ncbi:MAG: hypothetical protein RSC68_03815 [Acinetobacter sp.]
MVGGCPECGKAVEASGKAPVEITSEVMDKYEVPSYYRDIEWDSQVLKNEFPNLTSHRMFNGYCAQLDKIYQIFKSGHIPNQSCLITAPPRRGKQVFAFSCIKQAISHGYKAVPVIDTSEWRRINVMSSEKVFSKTVRDLEFSVEDIVSADIVFLTVDKDNFQGAYRSIESLVDKRARKDKPTFIISRFTVEQISYLDFDGNFTQIIDKTRMLNQMKYLGLIIGE